MRLRAADLLTPAGGHLRPGDSVVSWGHLSQVNVAKQPTLQLLRFANASSQAVPAVVFSGLNSTALAGALELGPEQTFIAVARTRTYHQSGGCCNSLACSFIPTADPTAFPPSTKGLAIKTSGQSVRLILDYDGENNQGPTPIENSDLILSTRYTKASAGRQSDARAAGCVQVAMKGLSSEVLQSTRALSLGSRESDPTHESGRYFDGALVEVLVFNRSLSDTELLGVEAFLAAQHGLLAKSFKCAAPAATPAEMVGARVDLTKQTELFLTIEKDPLPSRLAETPHQTWLAATKRTRDIEQRVQVATPDPHINAGIPMAAAAVDGLWRESVQTFVHGAMAWDVPLVGWRSEYGATVFGQPERVALEGARMVKSQVQPECALPLSFFLIPRDSVTPGHRTVSELYCQLAFFCDATHDLLQ